MSAPVPPLAFDPTGPLSPDLRSEIAYGRARGRSWEDLAGVFKCDPGTLRRAAEKDLAFAGEQKNAWDEVVWEVEADCMQRLRQVAAGEGERAARVAEVLVKYAHERHRDETRLAIEKMRTAAKIATGKVRSEKSAEKAAEGPKCPVPASRLTAADAPGASPAKAGKPTEELSPEAVEVLGRLAMSLGKNQAEREGFSDRGPDAKSRMEQLLRIIQPRAPIARASDLGGATPKRLVPPQKCHNTHRSSRVTAHLFREAVEVRRSIPVRYPSKGPVHP